MTKQYRQVLNLTCNSSTASLLRFQGWGGGVYVSPKRSYSTSIARFYSQEDYNMKTNFPGNMLTNILGASA